MPLTCRDCEHSLYFKETGNWYCGVRETIIEDYIEEKKGCNKFEQPVIKEED